MACLVGKLGSTLILIGCGPWAGFFNFLDFSFSYPWNDGRETEWGGFMLFDTLFFFF